MRLAFLAACLLGGALWPGAAQAQGHLSFGLITPVSEESTRQQWQPFLDALGRHLGVLVDMRLSADYAGVIRGLQSGQLDMAWLGNESAIKAVDNARAEIFAKQVYASGLPEYYSLMVVNARVNAQSADDVFAQAAKLAIAMGEVNSTSGFLVPSYQLFDHYKISPGKAFLRGLRGSHQQNLENVANGVVDVAFVASNHYISICKSHPAVAASTRVVWHSTAIPSDPMLWRSDLPVAQKAKIAEFFTGYGVPMALKDSKTLAAERAVLDKMDIHHFVASDNSQLRPIRQIELFKSRQTIEEDAHLTPADRDRQLGEINRQMDDLVRH